MKYQCVNCKKTFNEQAIIIVGINTGWNFYTSTIFCNECYELYKKSYMSCVDCKYKKTKRKIEPCKGCKNHCNWEDKGK